MSQSSYLLGWLYSGYRLSSMAITIMALLCFWLLVRRWHGCNIMQAYTYTEINHHHLWLNLWLWQNVVTLTISHHHWHHSRLNEFASNHEMVLKIHIVGQVDRTCLLHCLPTVFIWIWKVLEVGRVSALQLLKNQPVSFMGRQKQRACKIMETFWCIQRKREIPNWQSVA